MRVYIVQVHDSVGLRDEKENPIPGYLSILRGSVTNKLELAFIPQSKLSANQVSALNDLVVKSKYGNTCITLAVVKSAHLQSGNVIELNEMISVELNQISLIQLANELTMSRNGSVCLVKMTCELENAEMPGIYFEYDGKRAVPMNQVNVLLASWMKTIGKQLRNVPSDKQVVQMYCIEDLSPNSLEKSSFLGFNVDTKWQAPQDSNSLFKFATGVGNLGYNVVANIVGKPLAETVVDRIEDATWDVMDKFSKVTQYSKQKTSKFLLILAQVLEHPLTRPIRPLIPSQITNYFVEDLLNDYDSAGRYLNQYASELNSPSVILAEAEALDKSRDYESFSIYAETDHSPVITMQEFDELAKKPDFKNQVFIRGIENKCRRQLWKLLLFQEPTVNYFDLKNQWNTLMEQGSDEIVETPSIETSAGDEKLNLDIASKIRERKHRVEKDVIRTDRQIEYYSGEANLELLPKNLQVLRDILVTFAFYDFDLGYVQGMNDLLAPILYVMDDEVDAFWCFCGLMKTARVNFFRDQSGMRSKLGQLQLLLQFMDPFLFEHLKKIDAANLFCCFRWLLVCFKREFEFEDILIVWERIWCSEKRDFDVFLAFAILNQHRNELAKCKAFDETLKFINDLSGKINVDDCISRAQILAKAFEQEFTEYFKSRMEQSDEEFVVVSTLRIARDSISESDLLQLLQLLT